jgi:ubiquinone/menaquinone biosynthesis C-methylase UbiE
VPVVSGETERVRRIYDDSAGKYDRQIGFCERLLFGGGREWVCSQARGRILEVAIGTGRNLPFYPDEVNLTGVELSLAMLEIARARARKLGVDADLRVGDAQALPFPDEAFDTVVMTLSLCTVPDDHEAVVEASRVLRPGGRLVLLEHVRSPVWPVRALQRVLDPLFVRFQADHLLRQPLDHLEDAGLEVELLERSKLGIVERLSARKPQPGARNIRGVV